MEKNIEIDRSSRINLRKTDNPIKQQYIHNGLMSSIQHTMVDYVFPFSTSYLFLYWSLCLELTRCSLDSTDVEVSHLLVEELLSLYVSLDISSD